MGRQRNRGNPPPDEPDEGSETRNPTRGPDESRKGPLRGTTPHEGESSPRRSASPNLAQMNVADILGNVGRRWEIEANTHMPLHLERCLECNRFVQHIADCSKGGLDQIIKVQRDHWIRELDNVFQNAYDDGYDRAMEKAKAREDEFKETIEDLHRRIQTLEQGGSRPELSNVQPMNISPRIPPVRKEQKRARPTSFDDPTKMGENPVQGKRPRASGIIIKERTVPKRQDPPKGKGKQRASTAEEDEELPVQKRTMYDTSSESDDSEGYLAFQEACAINRRATEQYFAQQANRDQPEVSTSQIPAASSSAITTTASANDAYSYSTVATSRGQWATTAHRQSANSRRSNKRIPSQLPPTGKNSRISNPKPFTYHNMLNGLTNHNGHPSVYPKSGWGLDPSFLWKRPVEFLNSGKSLQLVREAAIIPYLVRSYAQRWVVRTATKRGILPEGLASAEPDVEDEEVLRNIPRCIRVDAQLRHNVEDITAWLFLIMTQPDEREGTRLWFWHLACLLFEEMGRYRQTLMQLGINLSEITDVPYIPRRFVHQGMWTQADLARHFYECGLRNRDANTHLSTFSRHWLEEHPEPPMEPNWGEVPAPHAIQSRASVQTVRNRRRRQLLPLAGEDWHDADLMVYDQAPPMGDLPQPEEMDQAPPQGVTAQPQVEANDAIVVEPDDEAPMNLEQDTSRM
jgi:hypothetical protein